MLESGWESYGILGFRSAWGKEAIARGDATTSCLEARDHRLNKWGFIYLFEMKPGEVPDWDDYWGSLGRGIYRKFLGDFNRCRSRCDKPQCKKSYTLIQEDIKAAAFLAVLHSPPLLSNACHRLPVLCPASVRAHHQGAPVHFIFPALPLLPPPLVALYLWYASFNLAFRHTLMPALSANLDPLRSRRRDYCRPSHNQRRIRRSLLRPLCKRMQRRAHNCCQ